MPKPYKYMADTTSTFLNQGIEETVNQIQQPISVGSPLAATVHPINGAEHKNGARLDGVIDAALEGLRALQCEGGEWLFQLEADATIPSEYILLQHYLDEIDPVIEEKLANYIRASQGDHGGWPLYYDGDFNMSCTVKAYYALKLAGDSADAPHLRRAPDAVNEERPAAMALFERGSTFTL